MDSESPAARQQDAAKEVASHTPQAKGESRFVMEEELTGINPHVSHPAAQRGQRTTVTKVLVSRRAEQRESVIVNGPCSCTKW